MRHDEETREESESGISAMMDGTALPQIRSEPLFDGRYTLADIRAMLYDPDAETPWADMLPSFQRLLVEWLLSQLESHTSNAPHQARAVASRPECGCSLLREPLAEYAHGAWSGWMRYLFGKSTRNADGTVTIPAWAVERWTRQVETRYADLPENEKDSDRTEADSMIGIMANAPLHFPIGAERKEAK